MKVKHLVFVLATSIAGSAVLSGCVPLMIGGAVGTTAFVTTDRRSTGSQMADNVMESRINYEITQVVKTGLHLTVTSYNRRVLLTGQVASEQDRITAQKVAQRSLEVKSVVNELKVAEPTSLSQRMSDSTLASKVRSYLVGTKDVSLNQMKVTVEDGTVYLMGLVTAKEAKIAADVASRVAGVRAVVKVFEVITEEEVEQRLSLINHSTTQQQTTYEPLTTSNVTNSNTTEVRLQ